MSLLNKHYSRLENYVFGMERDRDVALDIIGETVARAWEKFDGLRDPNAFLSWTLTIAHRLIVAARRRARRFQTLGHHYAEELRSHASPPDLGPDVEALYAALGHLNRRQREAILLFEIAGLSLREVVDVQGGSIGALKVRLYRGRQKLAKILGAIPSRQAYVTVDRTDLKCISMEENL